MYAVSMSISISLSLYINIFVKECDGLLAPPTEQQLWFWPFAKGCIAVSPVNVYMSVYTYTFI